jgi:hypothetical protein
MLYRNYGIGSIPRLGLYPGLMATSGGIQLSPRFAFAR